MKAVGLSMAAALVAAVSLCSCSKAEEQFSDEPCYFVFDNSVHQNSTLATAMASKSPGVFCLVRETRESGATYFEFTNNQGLSSSSIANAVDMQRTRRLGRQNGLIVGYATPTSPRPCSMPTTRSAPCAIRARASLTAS